MLKIVNAVEGIKRRVNYLKIHELLSNFLFYHELFLRLENHELLLVFHHLLLLNADYLLLKCYINFVDSANMIR